jgi:hypothetical protein
MSFTNLYEESDKSNRYRWKVAGFMILAGIIFVLTTHFCEADMSPEATEKRINQSAGLKRVDRICNELPKPAGFDFATKYVSGSTKTYAVTYRYTSEKPKSEIKQFYTNWLEVNGWEPDKNGYIEFRKDNQQVSIELTGGSKGNYSINCAEKQL